MYTWDLQPRLGDRHRFLSNRLVTGQQFHRASDDPTVLRGLAGRALVMGLRGRTEFITPKGGPQGDSLTREMTLPKDELIVKTRQHAVEMSQEFFSRFGWNPSHQQLTILQPQLASLS